MFFTAEDVLFTVYSLLLYGIMVRLPSAERAHCVTDFYFFVV